MAGRKKASETTLFPGAVPLTPERLERLRHLVGHVGVRLTKRDPHDADEPDAFALVDLTRGELVLEVEARPTANMAPRAVLLFTTDGREIEVRQDGPAGSGVLGCIVRPARAAP